MLPITSENAIGKFKTEWNRFLWRTKRFPWICLLCTVSFDSIAYWWELFRFRQIQSYHVAFASMSFWVIVSWFFLFSLVFNFCAVRINHTSNAEIHHNSSEYVFTCAQEKHVYHKLKLREQMKMAKKWWTLFITRRASMELGICIKKNTETTKWNRICLFLQMRLTNPLRQPANCFANYLFFISRSFMQNIRFYSSAWSKYMDIFRAYFFSSFG